MSGASGPRSVEDVLITGELGRRASRPPDHSVENRAVTSLAQQLAADPAGVLQRCAGLVLELCRADSAGVSILEPGGPNGLFRWHGLAGALAAASGRTIPRDASPCGTAIARNSVVLFREADRFFPELRGVQPRMFETLLAPWQVNGEPIGTLWAVKHTPEGQFDAEDARLLADLARFAAAAYQTTLALDAAKTGREELKRRVEERTNALAHANTRLRDREIQFRRALNIKTVGVLLFRLDGHMLDANLAFERMSGYSAEELRSSIHWNVLTCAEFTGVTRQAADELANCGQTLPYEKQLVRKNGSRWWALCAPTRLKGHGAESDCIEFIIDITEQKQAEAALRESERRFRTLAQGIPQLVFRSRVSGERTWVSPQWVAFTGMSAEESLGLGWLTAIHPDDRAATMTAWAEAEASGTFSTEHRVRSAADGSYRWFQGRASPLRDETDRDSAEWLGTLADIEDQVRAREVLTRSQSELETLVAERTAELMAAEEALRHSQKMEAVGRLTGGIAHDFNNMLQGISGGLETAQRRIAQGRPADAEKYLDMARDTIGRAARLVSRLLTFSRRQSLQPRPVDADGLIAGMADLIRRTMGPSVGVELKLRDGAGAVLCDPHELESALLNLCINARDAMPDGGRLTIGTEDVRLSSIERFRAGVTVSDFVAFFVADNGIGMTPDVQERVFEPFFTTKPVGEGTGLGLSQVYGFIRQSGGLVRLESVPGQGTTVRLLLPLQSWPEAAVPQPAASAEENHAGSGETVLLVDDEQAVRQLAAERLRELGYKVLEAAEGPAALSLLDEGAQFDLLVTDIGLPHGMNGRQLAEAVRERRPGVAVLFITGYAATQLPAGTEVVRKPFELDALIRRVQALIAEKHRGSTGHMPKAE